MPPDAVHRARAVALYTNLSAPDTLAQSGVKRGMSKKKHAQVLEAKGGSAVCGVSFRSLQ